MWGTIISTVGGIGNKLLGNWNEEDARDEKRKVARLENRDQWTMRLCAAVIFTPWVWAWFDPEAGKQAVAVMRDFPAWYQGLVNTAAAAGLGVAKFSQAKRERKQ